MSYGPRPWLQTQWDARAAANFMAGGTGAGLALCAALLEAAGLPDALWVACAVLGLVLVGAGLSSVWFEIGRPLRALNVLLNPRSSWMTREAMVAPLLAGAALALWATRSPFFALLLALSAVGFVYAQGRLLHAARGIAAWHEPALPPWIVLTGITEGAGLASAIGATMLPPSSLAAAALVLLVLARAALWRVYRRRVEGSVIAGAARALDEAGRALTVFGTLLPVALAGASVALAQQPAVAGVLLGAAGLGAWLAGWRVKFGLVCRASFNRGFSLAHLPVRGRP